MQMGFRKGMENGEESKLQDGFDCGFKTGSKVYICAIDI
jgi:hypothetical protein